MDSKKRKDWLVRIICFIAAFSLWLYVSNEDNTPRTTKLTVPVQLINEDAISQAKLAVSPNQKINVTLTIRGQFVNIYSVKADQFKVTADMGTYSLKKGENRIPVEIKSSPDSINVVNTDLWVKVNLDAIVEKSVPVKTSLDIRTKPGYYASSPVVKPAQVTISGPSSYVNSVQYVLAKKNDIRDIDKETTFTVPLQAMDSSDRVVNEVKIDPTNVNVHVFVKKSKTVSINLKTKGSLTSGLTLKSMSNSIDKVEISGSQDDLSRINSIDTEPIDMSSISASGNVKVKLIVPDNVTILNSDGYVNVSINIDKIVQNTITKDIQIKNLDSNLNAKLDKTKVTLVIQGNQSDINDSKIQSIVCYIDLNGKIEGDVVSTIVIPQVDGITVVSTDIKNVNVVLTKK